MVSAWTKVVEFGIIRIRGLWLLTSTFFLIKNKKGNAFIALPFLENYRSSFFMTNQEIC